MVSHIQGKTQVEVAREYGADVAIEIYGKKKKVNEDWRRLHKEEILNLSSSPNYIQ